MDLLQNFQHNLKENLVPVTGANTILLLAVSGGVDSVVLCDLFSHSNYNFFIAHCNFQLREEESERDEAFVRNLAVKYGKDIFVKRFDTARYATAHKVSTQVAARELRYTWFRSLLPRGGKEGWIVTAHHADDNIETTVMNFFRGTGLKGLVGMDVLYESIYRPMLAFRKQEIYAYAAANQLLYVEDSSNATNNYTRNYFRNELLPAIGKVFPGVEDNILRNIKRLQETGEVYARAILQHRKNLVVVKGKEEHIPVLKLLKTTPLRTIVWEIIKEKNFTAAQVGEVIKLLDADNGSYIQSESHRIIKNRKWLIITKNDVDELTQFLVIEESDRRMKFANREVVIERLQKTGGFSIPVSAHVACFDSGEMRFPLLLRKWKQGDYFYPLGMKKKKKISRFLIDQKLSLTEKENVWLLEMNKKVLWVIGYRIDDRFKIQPSTQSILKLTITAVKDNLTTGVN